MSGELLKRGRRLVLLVFAGFLGFPGVTFAQFGITPPLTVGCDWILAFDPANPAVGNAAFPETNARYWFAVVSDTVPQGSRLRVEGRYPDARYAALHTYDGTLFYLDALSDNQLLPDPGSANRNLDATRRDSTVLPGGSYTGYLRINQDIPAVRERNTLYRKPPGLLDTKARKRTVLAYRTYLPEGGNDGKVGLPRLVLERPGFADVPLLNSPDVAGCEQIKQVLTQPGSGTAVLLAPIIPLRKPVFQKYDPVLLQALGLGVGYNPHNGFMYAKTQKEYGDLVVVRGRMPRFTTQSSADPMPQVRFLSFCQYGSSSTRVHGCIADHQLPLDAAGYYTVVISKDTLRPSGLPSIFGWLPSGPETNTLVAVRELLASPTFTQSIQMAPSGTGNGREGYTPLVTYCSIPTLTQAIQQGLSPGDVYARCASQP